MAHPVLYTPTYGQAQRFIKKAGGVSALARMMNCDRTTIYKWLYPKNKGGTDGLIPSSRIADIEFAFSVAGIEIKPGDWALT